MIGNPNLVNDLIPESVLLMPAANIFGIKIVRFLFHRYYILFYDDDDFKDFQKKTTLEAISKFTIGDYLKLRDKTNFIPKLGPKKLDICDYRVNKLILCSSSSIDWKKYCTDIGIDFVSYPPNKCKLIYLIEAIKSLTKKHYGETYSTILEKRLFANKNEGMSQKDLADSLDLSSGRVAAMESRLCKNFSSMIINEFSEDLPKFIFDNKYTMLFKEIVNSLKKFETTNYHRNLSPNSCLIIFSEKFEVFPETINENIYFFKFLLNDVISLPDKIKHKIPIF